MAALEQANARRSRRWRNAHGAFSVTRAGCVDRPPDKALAVVLRGHHEPLHNMTILYRSVKSPEFKLGVLNADHCDFSRNHEDKSYMDYAFPDFYR
jgi:hypothetical protein